MAAVIAGLPVTGRTQPRPRPLPLGFAHDVRYYGLASGEIRAVCEPCDWATTIEPGHRTAALNRLAREHAGVTS